MAARWGSVCSVKSGNAFDSSNHHFLNLEYEIYGGIRVFAQFTYADRPGKAEKFYVDINRCISISTIAPSPSGRGLG